MLLPVPDSLSLNEEGSDGRVDSPLPSPSSLLFTQVRRGRGKTKHSRLKAGGSRPIRRGLMAAGLAWSGWERVILRVPEHLRAMSVMPKRATRSPPRGTDWAAGVGVPDGGTLFSDKGLNLSM